MFYDYRFGPSADPPPLQNVTRLWYKTTCPRKCGRVMPTDKRPSVHLSDS